MTSYKLNYFGIRLYGEPIRWLFLANGTPFQNDIMEVDEWLKLTTKPGWGQLPILDMDGETVTQSVAICQLLGKKFGMNGETDLEAARCLEYALHLQEVKAEWSVLYMGNDYLETQEKTKKNLVSTIFPKYLSRFNKIVTDNGGNYLVGKKVTWADLYFVNFLQIWEEVDPKLLESYPALRQVKENVLNIPAIKDWVAERQPTSYNGISM